MKRIIALFLLLQFLTGHSFAVEMAKLPFLIHHKEHHSKESFIDFIKEHYNAHKLNDDHEHQHLPLKGDANHQSSLVQHIAFLHSFDYTLLDTRECVGNISFPNNQLFASFYTCDIWQPPKLS